MGTNGDLSWRLNFMGTTGKTIDVIPQVSKSSHYLPLYAHISFYFLRSLYHAYVPYKDVTFNSLSRLYNKTGECRKLHPGS